MAIRFMGVAAAALTAALMLGGAAGVANSATILHIGPDSSDYLPPHTPLTCAQNTLLCEEDIETGTVVKQPNVLTVAQELFDNPNLIQWDKWDAGQVASEFDRIDVTLTTDKQGSWTLNPNTANSFNPAFIVGFAIHAGQMFHFYEFLPEHRAAFAGLNLLNGDNLIAYFDISGPFDIVGKNGKLLNTDGYGFSNITIFGDDTITTVIPLPAPFLLLASALAGFGLLGWRRRQRTA